MLIIYSYVLAPCIFVCELLYIHMTLNIWSRNVYILTQVSSVLIVILKCLNFLHRGHPLMVKWLDFAFFDIAHMFLFTLLHSVSRITNAVS